MGKKIYKEIHKSDASKHLYVLREDRKATYNLKRGPFPALKSSIRTCKIIEFSQKWANYKCLLEGLASDLHSQQRTWSQPTSFYIMTRKEMWTLVIMFSNNHFQVPRCSYFFFYWPIRTIFGNFSFMFLTE